MTLRKTTFSAARWTTISAIFRACMQLLQMAVLARLLVPGDFGLMAMAGVAAAVTSLFADLGLSSALMHFPRPDPATLSTLFWLNLAFSLLLALLFAAAGWPLAYVYGEPDLVSVMIWLSVSFPLAAIGQQFRVLAEKDLRFAVLAQNEIAATVAGTAIAVVAALAGYGVFALVMALVASAAVNSLLAWWRLSAGLQPQTTFRPMLARPFVAFGLHRVGDGFWNTIRMQADVFIAGLFAAPAVVAAYAVPRDLTLKIANTVINPVITRVGLPVMTRLQDDPAALRAVYLKTLGLTASFNFPLYALLALFPEQIVSLLLGDQWDAAAFYLRLFALWGLIRSTGNPSGSLLYAVGMARRAHAWNLLLFFATVPLLWVAAKLGGLTALAWTMLGWQAAVYVLAWRCLVRPACGAGFSTYNASIAPPLGATVLASAFAYVAASVLPPSFQLPAGSLVLAGGYLLLSWFYNRQWIEAMAELLRVPAPVRRS
ncbi:MOP flippase family protein [Luteimonas sp. A537]